MLNILANTKMRGPTAYWMSGFVDIIHVAKFPIDKIMTFFCKTQYVHHKGFVMTHIIKVWMCVLEQLEQLRYSMQSCTCSPLCIRSTMLTTSNIYISPS
jgi:hypothetical protein